MKSVSIVSERITIARAVLRASVSAVSEGFAEPSVGKSAGPATYAFGMW